MTDRTPKAGLELNQDNDLVSLVYVDNRDPRVQYTEHWSMSQNTSSTIISGSQSSLAFSGSMIAVYGIVPANGNHSEPPSASYSIDGVLTVRCTQNYSVQGSQAFFTSQELVSTEHTLVINVTDAASGYVLDFFAIAPPQNGTATATATPVRSTLSERSMIAAIVSTVVGSIVVLLLAFFIWFKFLRKQPRKGRPPPPPDTPASPRKSSHRGMTLVGTTAILYNDTPESLKMNHLSRYSDNLENPLGTPATVSSDLSTLRFA